MRMSFFPLLATAIRQEEETKEIQVGKGKMKLSLFADNMIIYLKDPIKFTEDFRHHKYFQQRSRRHYQYTKIRAFLYTNNKQTKNSDRKIPLIIALKINYLGINLTNEMKDPYNINYKPLKKEIEDDIGRWKDFPCSWVSNL
jgi:hypothetical protein